jgi:predicted P-loop ATPase
MSADKFDKEFDKQFKEFDQTPTTLKKTINILKSDDQLKGAFCFNMFTQDIEHFQDNIILAPSAKAGSLVTDIDVSCLRTYLTMKYNFSPSRNNLEDALSNCAMDKRYHPIKDYLDTLRWDGITRLETWLIDICGAKDNAYVRAVSRKVLVAAIKRIYDPGCQYAQLVILEGRQRMYKSRLVKAMGKEFYASVHLKTQDAKAIVEESRGKWILEIEELAGFGKQETEFMKAFISRQHDRVRLSYGRRAADYPRQSIMIATMNPDAENKYLNDPTGNFRYWPILCGESNIEVDKFEDNRDQLFAEAMAIYEKEKLWLTPEEEALASVEQENRLQTDPWYGIITHWLNDQVTNKAMSRVTTTEIATGCLRIASDKLNSGIWRRIGRVLVTNNWQKLRDSNPPRDWYYVPPTAEIKEWKE